MLAGFAYTYRSTLFSFGQSGLSFFRRLPFMRINTPTVPSDNTVVLQSIQYANVIEITLQYLRNIFFFC